MHKHVYTYIYTCIYMHVYTLTYTHADIYIYACSYTLIHTHIYAYAHNMYICTHASTPGMTALQRLRQELMQTPEAPHVSFIRRNQPHLAPPMLGLHCTHFLRQQYPSTPRPLFPTYPRTVRGPRHSRFNCSALINTSRLKKPKKTKAHAGKPRRLALVRASPSAEA